MPLLTLSRAGYPGIDPVEIGNAARRGYGSVEDVRVPAIVAGAASYLAAAMTAAATSITVADGSRFPAAPFTAQIGGERVTVGAISGNTLSSITRAIYNTTAEPHAAGRTVYEVRTSYVYLVSDQPVDAIGAVYVDGVKQSSGYTAYTGQAGDAHADWAGQAVIEFTVDPFVGQQRNLADAGTKDVVTVPDLCTDDGIGTDIALLGGTLAKTLAADTGADTFWCSWPAGVGTIVKDSVAISFSEAAAGSVPARLRVSSRDTTTGATIKTEIIYLDADASGRSFTFNLGTVWPVKLTIYCETGSATINTITRTVTRTAQPAGESVTTITDAPVLKSDERLGATASDAGIPLGAAGADLAWATFDATDRGTIASMSAYGSLYSAAGAVVYLCGVNGNTLLIREQITVPAGGVSGFLGTIAGGAWGTHLAVVVESGTVALEYLSRVVGVLADNASSDSGMTSARATIGERVTVDADWHYDATGDYGGAGNLITRPDWCFKHFAVNYMGATLAEIDATSFSAAGTLYAAAITGGYKFQGIIPKDLAWTTLKRMAFDCRSTVRFLAGKYYLDYTPDTAPAVVRTLTTADLAGLGAQFIFSKSPMRGVYNDLTALYRPNHSGDTSREISSGHLASTAASDATSIAKYGTYSQEYQMRFVRSSAMAAHVLAHHLLELKVPLLGASAVLFWEHSDLVVGDTVGITAPIYTGRKWWVSALSGRDKFTLDVSLKEWW